MSIPQWYDADGEPLPYNSHWTSDPWADIYVNNTYHIGWVYSGIGYPFKQNNCYVPAQGYTLAPTVYAPKMFQNGTPTSITYRGGWFGDYYPLPRYWPLNFVHSQDTCISLQFYLGVSLYNNFYLGHNYDFEGFPAQQVIKYLNTQPGQRMGEFKAFEIPITYTVSTSYILVNLWKSYATPALPPLVWWIEKADAWYQLEGGYSVDYSPTRGVRMAQGVLQHTAIPTGTENSAAHIVCDAFLGVLY
jgi:hypothetical protein